MKNKIIMMSLFLMSYLYGMKESESHIINAIKLLANKAVIWDDPNPFIPITELLKTHKKQYGTLSNIKLAALTTIPAELQQREWQEKLSYIKGGVAATVVLIGTIWFEFSTYSRGSRLLSTIIKRTLDGAAGLLSFLYVYGNARNYYDLIKESEATQFAKYKNGLQSIFDSLEKEQRNT